MAMTLDRHPHKRMAAKLGIGHETLGLIRHAKKSWSLDGLSIGSVETAALAHWKANGWNGTSVEGGVILMLIKAAAFHQLDPNYRTACTEAIFAQHWAEPSFNDKELLRCMWTADRSRVERNCDVIAGRSSRSTATNNASIYPGLERGHVLGLFDALGVERLHAIAEIFTRAPYDYRAGWPDLTLWNGRNVIFREVKAPGDLMHPSQERLITDLLRPLGFDVALVDVHEISDS